MRCLYVVLLAPAVAYAAPVPKELKPAFALTLSEGGMTTDLTLEVHNRGKQPLALRHVGILAKPFEVLIRDESGKPVAYEVPERSLIFL